MEYGTDPFEEDTDMDSLSDGDEVNVYRSDPLKYDTDGDTLGNISLLIFFYFKDFFTISGPFINISFFSSFVFSLAIEEKEKSFKT